MVFFQKQLTRTVVVHPMHLGAALRAHVRDQLVAEVEGMPIENAGFIITVLKIEDEHISKGMVDALSGFVKYNVRVEVDGLVPGARFQPMRPPCESCRSPTQRLCLGRLRTRCWMQ